MNKVLKCMKILGKLVLQFLIFYVLAAVIAVAYNIYNQDEMAVYLHHRIPLIVCFTIGFFVLLSLCYCLRRRWLFNNKYLNIVGCIIVLAYALITYFFYPPILIASSDDGSETSEAFKDFLFNNQQLFNQPYTEDDK